ncbi:MAG: phosphoribosyltransferase family protein [Chloroflexia bacterium]
MAGPTTGGAILSFEFARQLDARSIFAEQSADGGREFGAAMIEPGERVLVVDDVMTTGASVRHTVEAVRALGGEVVGAGLLVDRSGGRSDVGTPVRAALTLDIPAYEPDDCPVCAAGAPLTKRGTSRTRSRSGA